MYVDVCVVILHKCFVKQARLWDCNACWLIVSNWCHSNDDDDDDVAVAAAAATSSAAFTLTYNISSNSINIPLFWHVFPRYESTTNNHSQSASFPSSSSPITTACWVRFKRIILDWQYMLQKFQVNLIRLNFHIEYSETTTSIWKAARGTYVLNAKLFR